MFNSARNSARSLYYLYGVYGDFKEIVSMDRNSQEFKNKVSAFKTKSVERVRQLCQINGGVYTRMGQIVSSMTGVLPNDILSQLKNLKNVESDEIPYQKVKNVLQEGIQKPVKEIFDGFQVKPFSTNMFYQTHRSILL